MPLVLSSAHRERDRRSDLRHGSRFKSPPSKCAGRRIIQNRAPRALGHFRAGHSPASRIDGHHADTTAGGMRSARFVGIFWSRRTDRDCLRGRHRHRTNWPLWFRFRERCYGSVARRPLWWRRGFFFNEFRFFLRNSFRWRWWWRFLLRRRGRLGRLLLSFERHFHSRFRNIVQIRYFFGGPDGGDSHRRQMERDRASKGCYCLPFWGGTKKQWSSHRWLSTWAHSGAGFALDFKRQLHKSG